MQSIVWRRQNWWAYWSHARPCQLESRLLWKRPSLPHMGPRKLEQTFLCVQAWPSCTSSRLGITFLLNARSTRRWYNCPWHIAVMHFSSIMFSYSYREWANLVFDSFAWDKIPGDRIFIFARRTTSIPYTNEYEVGPVEVRIEVGYAHKANGKYSCQSLYVSVIFTKIFFMLLLVAFIAPFIWGR